MSQEQLDKLVADGLELFVHNDQYELSQFFDYLADKYNLQFNKKQYEEGK